MVRTISTLLTGVIFINALFSQDKLVVDDRTGFFTPAVEELVKTRLAENEITYTSLVDFKVRCEYFYAELIMTGEDLFLGVKDCDNNLLGSENLGKGIRSSKPEEQAILLSYMLIEIISNPGKHLEQYAGSEKVRTGDRNVAPEASVFQLNEHNSRYFFAPSAHNLKKGELYYNSVYFLLHDIQYGFSDYFSVGIGTSVIGIPLYLTPKLSFPIGDNSAIALGDMLIFGTYGTDALGNLLYGNFSTGGTQGNISLGLGYLATNESDLTGKTSSMVFNLSGMVRASSQIYLLTENYYFGVNTMQYAYLDSYDEATDTYLYLNEAYSQRLNLWYGIAGFRIISKNRDFVSWQIGITYVLNFPGKVPDQYTNWDTGGPEGFNVIAFPALSYTRKFGKKY